MYPKLGSLVLALTSLCITQQAVAQADAAAPETPPPSATEPATEPAPTAPPPVAVTTPVATLDCSALLEKARPAPSQLAQLASEQLERLGAFEPGALGELLIREIVAEVCAAPEVQVGLAITCAPPPAPDVRQLRARLVADAAGAIATQAEALARSAGAASQTTQGLLLGAALQAVLQTPSLRGLAQRLMESAPWTLRQDCSVSGQANDPYRDLQVTAVLIVQLEQQLEARARQLTQQDWEALAQQYLVATGKHAAGQALSELQREALSALLAVMAEARKLQAQALDAAGYAKLAAAYAATLAHAASLAADRTVALPTFAAEIALDLGLGNVEDGLAKAAVTVLGANGGKVVDALLFGMRVARARSEEEARGMLARAALGLGPWADRWVVGLNVGIPSLDFDDFKIVGDAKLGYNGQSFGAIARGYLNVYDYTSNIVLASSYIAGGSGEFWFTFNSRGRVKGEIRADVGSGVYDTDSVPLDSARTIQLADETSVMVRGTGLAGLRIELSQAAFGLWLGGGAQYEMYNALTVDTVGDTIIRDQTSTNAMLTGRLRAQFPIVPRIIGGRVRADALRHTITRESLTTDIDSRTGASASSALAGIEQIEIGVRGFIDLQIAQFFGFVPAIEGGLDYFSLSDPGGEVATRVPVLGVGIRRTEF